MSGRPVVLLAVDAPDLGWIVLGRPIQGERPVAEGGVCPLDELPDRLGRLADLYGDQAPIWGTGSREEEELILAQAKAGAAGSILGPQGGVLAASPRLLRVSADPLPGRVQRAVPAYQRAWALAQSFRLRL